MAGKGMRFASGKIIKFTDWNREYVRVDSKLQKMSPLPTIASFDLLNPLDNSGNGYQVKQGGGQVQYWGLHYENGAKPSVTTLVKQGQGAVSFLTAFRLTAMNRYINIFSCRATGAGFNFYFSDQLLMAFIYPSGTPGTIASGDVGRPELDTWYVASGVFDPVNRTASVRIGDLGLRFGNIGDSMPTNTTLDTALHIGGDPNGSITSSMSGDIAFTAIYDGAFTTEQRDAMVSVGMDVLTDRGLI
ncbi:LamG domain-containing protein [Serratia ficaria]|uniref:LamG domain-containing protein n=1 Tax=Serratia ficaria TaxID=61651 RepID=UPI002183870A|nr:LamG domain-containing protein [Serratia ficaria]CAI2527866.1 Uncharacterised protein [Serratia ficaria]